MYGPENVVAEGQLTYGTSGLFGTGELRYLTAKHNSETEGYTFYRRSFESGEQDFRVKTSASDEQWAFQMLESSARVDFDKREGVFDKLDPASYRVPCQSIHGVHGPRGMADGPRQGGHQAQHG